MQFVVLSTAENGDENMQSWGLFGGLELEGPRESDFWRQKKDGGRATWDSEGSKTPEKRGTDRSSG